ncbi:unnamed protein product [Nyctereutes procyonoides]|uniref:(raccoon dog) hypothetical protein n=1 Tax=Nyctereutes procyonoides TaxID=34880 RepID=A0A811YJL5_NYCPR|nr:unnamed protein product [Nyctereutes procyonoides]
MEYHLKVACVPAMEYHNDHFTSGLISMGCFAFLLGASECYLLAVMSYDRYVTICKPLHYTTIMSSKICIQLVLRSWITGFLIIFPGLILGLSLDFCDSNVIDHFYCDTAPLLQISCTDRHVLEMMSFILALVTLLVTLALKKAFSTCSSHMIVISLSYGSCIFMYLKPSVKKRICLMKRVEVLNTSVAPLLNPFIYTLRKQQAKQTFYFSVPFGLVPPWSLGCDPGGPGSSPTTGSRHGACFSLCLCLCLSLSLSLCVCVSLSINK